MVQADFSLTDGRPRVVGCFGSRHDLATATPAEVGDACDLVEVRLDLLDPAGSGEPPWQLLHDLPLLFTARRSDEGGAGSLSAETRSRMLRAALGEAACIDVEVASLDELAPLLDEVRARNLPWIASFHDFNGLPAMAVLEAAAARARATGAHAFKAAVRLDSPAAMARLAEFQLADHGLPVATMGMGPLATVSRLLCAQCGSVLNYGYLGLTATAPGQWQAGMLRRAIALLPPWVGDH